MGGGRGDVERVARLEQVGIEEAVVSEGGAGDVEDAAVGAGVAEEQPVSVRRHRLAIDGQFYGAGAVAGKLRDRPQSVRGGAQQAFGPGRHRFDHLGIETDAGHEEEVSLVGAADVDAVARTIDEYSQSLFGRFRDAGLLTEDVAHAAAQYAKGGRRAGDAVEHFVDRAVTPAGENDLDAVSRGRARELDAVARG